MNLVTFFPRSRHLREEALAGPLGPFLEGFLAWASRVGYTRHSLRDLVRGALQYSCSLAHQGPPDLRHLSDRQVQDFVASTPVRRIHGKYWSHVSRPARAAPHILRYLRHLGVVPPAPAVPAPLYHDLLTEWLSFLSEHRGLAATSVQHYRWRILGFLEDLGPLATAGRLMEVTVEEIRSYLRRRTSRCGRYERQAKVSALRQFLAFALERGYLRRDLRPAVDRVPSFTHEQLPRGPRWEDALTLLKTPDRRSLQGRRDYAILLLLLTYGVRAVQLSALTLEDIDWRSRSLRFCAAKGGRPISVPLTQPAGDALLTYLRKGRPPGVEERRLFLTLCAPIRPMQARSISNVVRRAFGLTGVPTPTRGSHSLRHAWATQMLREGHSLKTIADLLGHRQIDSTRIYTKVDFTQLAQVPLPWPVLKEELP